MNTWFITGASGVGKTTVLDGSRRVLPADRFVLHDIDERGVPADTPNTWDSWRAATEVR